MHIFRINVDLDLDLFVATIIIEFLLNDGGKAHVTCVRHSLLVITKSCMECK